jgi:hypothetical protein
MASPPGLPGVALVASVAALGVLMAEAHQSGCHAAHTCLSTPRLRPYICGDTGHRLECPDTDLCLNQQPRPVLRATLLLNRDTATRR